MTETTFKAAYGVLQQHAATLQGQENPDVDDLLVIVSESVAAYQVCRTRIEAVEKALKESAFVMDAAVATTPKVAHDAMFPIFEKWNDPEPAASGERDIPFFMVLVQPQFQSASNRVH